MLLEPKDLSTNEEINNIDIETIKRLKNLNISEYISIQSITK